MGDGTPKKRQSARGNRHSMDSLEKKQRVSFIPKPPDLSQAVHSLLEIGANLFSIEHTTNAVRSGTDEAPAWTNFRYVDFHVGCHTNRQPSLNENQ